MDAGKVKVVLDALQDELRARRSGAAQPSSDTGGESPAGRLVTVAPAAASAASAEENTGGSEFSQRPIPELVVPFVVPQEPFVSVGSCVLRAVLAAAAVTIALLFLL